MPDLTITCPDCGKDLVISEFVEDSGLTCRGCGRALTRPVRADVKPKPKLATKRVDNDEARGEGELPEMTSKGMWPGSREIGPADARAKVMHHRYAWVLFIVLGGALGYLRYGGGFAPAQMAMAREVSLIGLVGLHLLIILKAFEDSIFHGILCLLVPFYSAYYIFFVSDSVYLRALIGAVLICIGQDGAERLQIEFLKICDAIRTWISSGG